MNSLTDCQIKGHYFGKDDLRTCLRCACVDEAYPVRNRSRETRLVAEVEGWTLRPNAEEEIR